MTDLERILPLWREMEAAGADYVLATVVAVEGSSYRRPGACMLLTRDGLRAGTISGGCLEAEVARRAWWLTESGPAVHRYSTAEDDGERPYGSGCGGVIWILLERRETAVWMLRALEHAYDRRLPLATAVILDGPKAGCRAFAGLEDSGRAAGPLEELARQTLESRTAFDGVIDFEGAPSRAFAHFSAPRPGLWIIGAGDDAQPLLRLAKELGWYVVVADGRSHLVTQARFPQADELHVLDMQAQQAEAFAPLLRLLQPHDAAVLMTHSFEQDSKTVASLLALDFSLAYLGVLGPQRRTRELLLEAAQILGFPDGLASDISEWIDRTLARLHAPTGLDLGAESPETVAFSVIAEILKSFTAATALPLRVVRAATPVSIVRPR